ncbi:AAA family ATPase [Streptomyces atratus]|uniref:AAA family ATPase n=1 Tax=Streptomyces atratus TaxID=1893 RepID=UPI00225AFDD1|nr:AAA family ATPase [Streptomyces atratus]MCX5342672.1 AAA family ATPase [Streptomyces atratus]
MPDQAPFESLEGLRGTGKSTLAPMLAAARGAVLVPTVPPTHQALRHEVDRLGNAEARMCFYLSALFTAADQIQRHLSAGTPVVVESYFARCLANHRAFGADLSVALPAGLPQPVTYYLVCEEGERQRRLARREKPVSRWDALAEIAAEQITDAYTSFQMHRVDTTGLDPDEVLQTVLTTNPKGEQASADTKHVAAHPDLLPTVPRRAEGARGA